MALFVSLSLASSWENDHGIQPVPGILRIRLGQTNEARRHFHGSIHRIAPPRGGHGPGNGDSASILAEFRTRKGEKKATKNKPNRTKPPEPESDVSVRNVLRSV